MAIQCVVLLRCRIPDAMFDPFGLVQCVLLRLKHMALARRYFGAAAFGSERPAMARNEIAGKKRGSIRIDTIRLSLIYQLSES